MSWRTVIIGFGRIADTLAEDHLVRKHFRHATHAEVLKDHPAFDWDAVIDPAPEALHRAHTKHGISHLWQDIDSINPNWQPEVAIIATPPNTRLTILKRLPTLRAIVVEKPLARDINEAIQFSNMCTKCGTLAQVNYLRRGDIHLQSLAAGGLLDVIGQPLSVFMIYGGGLYNMASHLIDLSRMLLGEVKAAQALRSIKESSINGDDPDIPFVLHMESGVVVTALTVDPVHYREAGLDIWGTNGRLCLMQEGLGIYRYSRVTNRGVANTFEIESGNPEIIPSTLGNSLYRMYDNLSDAMKNGVELWSDSQSACRTEAVVNAIVISAKTSGTPATII